MIRASFVIPAYNSERWISKTIWSCRNQTEKKIEILVINDGSTDQTKDIAEWHAKEDRRVIVHNCPNRGRSGARNYGNSQVQSDLIFVLDSDDFASRNRVKDSIAVFELKKADFVYGSFFVMDAYGKVITDQNGKPMPPVRSSPFDPEVAKQKKMNFICHSTVAYTKKVAEAVKYEEGEWSKLGLDDWKFQWEVHKKGFVMKNIRNPIAYYRDTEDNTINTRDQKEVLRVKEEYLAQAL